MKIENAFRSPFCVYGHFCDGEVIYVGSGAVSRPFSTQRSHRWVAVVAGRPVDVVIFDWFESRHDALKAEFALIEMLDPLANIIRGNNPIALVCYGQLDMNLLCVETNQVFSSIPDIVYALGIGRQSLYYYLKGVLPTARGFTFVQTELSTTPLPATPAKVGGKRRLKWPIRCVQTGQQFHSILDVTKTLRISRRTVVDIIAGRRVNLRKYTFVGA